MWWQGFIRNPAASLRGVSFGRQRRVVCVHPCDPLPRTALLHILTTRVLTTAKPHMGAGAAISTRVVAGADPRLRESFAALSPYTPEVSIGSTSAYTLVHGRSYRSAHQPAHSPHRRGIGVQVSSNPYQSRTATLLCGGWLRFQRDLRVPGPPIFTPFGRRHSCHIHASCLAVTATLAESLHFRRGLDRDHAVFFTPPSASRETGASAIPAPGAA